MNKNILKRKLFTLAPMDSAESKQLIIVLREVRCGCFNHLITTTREGNKQYKNSDRATECAMTGVGKVSKNNFLQQKQPNCLAALSLAASPETNHSPLTTHHLPKRKTAFTLAEVLITLGIIGVVAALTLPSVIQSYKEKETVAKLKKTYSILNQAMANAVNEYGTLDTWELGGGDSPEGAKLLQDRIFSPNLKIINYCEKRNSCIGDKPYKYLTGTIHIAFPDNDKRRRLVLADGTTLIYQTSGSICNSDTPRAWTGCAVVTIDVDGYYKGPNTFGKDTFTFNIMKNRIVPYGTQEESPNFQATCNTKNTYGSACTAWVIFNENMDYLHCDDLSWNGKTKCK